MNKTFVSIFMALISLCTVIVSPAAGLAEQLQRSILVPEYPREKLEKISKNLDVTPFLGKLEETANRLKQADAAYTQLPSGEAEAQLTMATAEFLNSTGSFLKEAISRAPSVTAGLRDYSAYLEDVEIRLAGDSSAYGKEMAAWIKNQRESVGAFLTDYTQMVQDLNEVQKDFATLGDCYLSLKKVKAQFRTVYGAASPTEFASKLTQAMRRFAEAQRIIQRQILDFSHSEDNRYQQTMQEYQQAKYERLNSF